MFHVAGVATHEDIDVRYTEGSAPFTQISSTGSTWTTCKNSCNSDADCDWATHTVAIALHTCKLYRGHYGGTTSDSGYESMYKVGASADARSAVLRTPADIRT